MKFFDSEALKRSFTTDKCGGLLLDVWENEPNISLDILRKTDLATSHIAGYSVEGKLNGTVAVIHAVGSYLDLPLDNWCPEELEKLLDQKIKIDCKVKTLQEVITELVLETYPIVEDDNNLRNNPLKFELLRSEYPYRNEFTAWEVELINDVKEFNNVILQLGFKISTR